MVPPWGSGAGRWAGVGRPSACRREARIGQLLGPTEAGARTDLTLGHDLRLIEPSDRADFRILAHGLDEPTLLGVQRRLEARIGQLLGEAKDTMGRPLGHDLKVIDHAARADFRILAHATIRL